MCDTAKETAPDLLARLVMKTTEGVFSRNSSVMLSSSCVSLVRACAVSRGVTVSSTCNAAKAIHSDDLHCSG